MPAGSYAVRKAMQTVGRPEHAYAEMRKVLEQHLLRAPLENGRFVQLVTGEERLREALSQRASPGQLLDVMEQRSPYVAQRINLVQMIAEALGGPVRTAISSIAERYGLARSVSSAPTEPSSVTVQPSLPTLPPLQLPAPEPSYSPQPSAPPAGGEDLEQRRRHTAIKTLSSLTRSQWRSLAYELGMAVGTVDDIERAASSSSEASRLILERYFGMPRRHRGNMIGTLIEALREQGMNMTADNLTDALQWL